MSMKRDNFGGLVSRPFGASGIVVAWNHVAVSGRCLAALLASVAGRIAAGLDLAAAIGAAGARRSRSMMPKQEKSIIKMVLDMAGDGA